MTTPPPEGFGAGAPGQLAQAPGAAPPYAPASWSAYEGGDAIFLAIVLALVAGAFACAGRRFAAPLAVARPGRVAAGFMIAIWVLSIVMVIVVTFVYGLEIREAYPGFVGRRVRVGTFVYAAATFFVILFLTRRFDWQVALVSGIFGAAAAPMLFELPFDLIVMTRTNPPIPGHPGLWRALFFLPLFLAELSTVFLLTLLPSMRVTASACYAFAGMIAVFALWALTGFAFPDEPLPFVLNVVAKILGFVTAAMLFAWREKDCSRAP